MTKKERITQNIQKKVVWETKIEGKHKSCLFLHKTINYEQRMEKPFAAETLRKQKTSMLLPHSAKRGG